MKKLFENYFSFYLSNCIIFQPLGPPPSNPPPPLPATYAQPPPASILPPLPAQFGNPTPSFHDEWADPRVPAATTRRF